MISAHALFCEMIREEVDGRHILLGVMSNQAIILREPGRIPLCAWVTFRGLFEGTRQFDAYLVQKMKGKRRERKLITGEMNIMVPQITVGLPLPNFGLKIDASCEVVLEISVDQKKRLRAGEIFIEIDETMPEETNEFSM